MQVFEITRHILYFYEIWKSYDEKDQMKDILNRMPKPRLTASARPSSLPTEQQLVNNPNQHNNMNSSNNPMNQMNKNNGMPINNNNNNNNPI